MFFKIFIFILIVAASFALVRFRYNIRETFGTISFFDKYLGSTETGIVVIAIIMFIVGLLYVSGKLEGFIYSIFGSIF